MHRIRLSRRLLTHHQIPTITNFITPVEEAALLDDVDCLLTRTPYNTDHWDRAISNYREIEKRNWSETSQRVIDRVRLEFKGEPLLEQTHVLDVAKDGHIMPHVDSVKFVGCALAGLSLLSDAIMRFRHVSRDEHFDVLLPRRSLYVMRDQYRYDWTHEVLSAEESRPLGVNRDRRISIMTRAAPSEQQDRLFDEFGTFEEDDEIDDFDQKPPPMLPPLK